MAHVERQGLKIRTIYDFDLMVRLATKAGFSICYEQIPPDDSSDFQMIFPDATEGDDFYQFRPLNEGAQLWLNVNSPS